MPKIRRRSLPPALLHHLLDRIRSREISASQLGLFADWLDTTRGAERKMVQTLSGMIVCGEADLVKTFLRPGQVAIGNEVQ
jgi:hypothetical protein